MDTELLTLDVLPTATLVAVAGQGNVVRLWDTRSTAGEGSGSPATVRAGNAAKVTRVALVDRSSPHLACACSDGVRIYDLRNAGAPLQCGRNPKLGTVFHTVQFAAAADSFHVRVSLTHLNSRSPSLHSLLLVVRRWGRRGIALAIQHRRCCVLCGPDFGHGGVCEGAWANGGRRSSHVGPPDHQRALGQSRAHVHTVTHAQGLRPAAAAAALGQPGGVGRW